MKHNTDQASPVALKEHYSQCHQAKLKAANVRSDAGFTLIEMIFYLFFITLITGSTLGIIYQLLRNSENLKSGINIEEEGNFILKKISWVLNDSSAVNSPVINLAAPFNSASVLLSVEKNNLGTENPVKIYLVNNVLKIVRGTNPEKQLNNNRFIVSSLSFDRSWDGSNPKTDLIKAIFYLNDRKFKLTRRIQL